MANGKFSAQTSTGMPTRTERVQQQYEVQKQEAVLAQQEIDQQKADQEQKDAIAEQKAIQDKIDYLKKEEAEWELAGQIARGEKNPIAFQRTPVMTKVRYLWRTGTEEWDKIRARQSLASKETIADYEKEYNKLQETASGKSAIAGGGFKSPETLKGEAQNNLSAEASSYLKDKGFGEGVSLTPPKQSVLSKAWSGIKTGYLASPFGTKYGGISESTQKELTSLREERTREAVSTRLLFGMGFEKFSTIPLKTSYEAIQKQRGLDYEAEQASKLLDQLDKISTEVSPELKPYVETEGLKILQQKGLEITETKYPDFSEVSKGGGVSTTTVFKVTDPSFERRISQNMLELEQSFLKQGKSYKGIGTTLVLTRAGSTSLIETYGIFEGVKLGVKGVVAGYKALGLPSPKFYKNVQLVEGVAKVPRTFSTTKTVLGVSLTGIYGFGKVRQYQSYKSTSEVGKALFLAETSGELAGIELSTGIGTKAYRKVANRIENFNLKTVKQADISQEGFLRQNRKLGFQERVYMDRYGGFKLTKPKSWLQTLQGYEKGQFTGRSYKFLPDELVAYYKYGENVPITSRTGKLRIVKAEAFPFDKTSTHLNWFLRRNIAEYPVPRKAKLPINVKGKSFGYSASGEEWAGTEFNPNEIFYVDKKGVVKILRTKGAVQYVSGKGVSAGFLRIFKRGTEESVISKVATKPIIYADYFSEAQINKAIREIRGIDVAGRELKAYIYSKQTGKAGTLNIPLYKREVEGTVEIGKRIPIRKAFAIKLEGWKVPIEEQVFASKSSLSSKELKSIIKEMGGIKEISGARYSSLPQKLTRTSAIYSIMGYSKASSVKSYKSLMSKISEISGVSQSTISRTSKASRMSGFSSYSPSMSDLLKSYEFSSTTSTPPTSKTQRISSILGSSKKERLKSKLRQKKYLEVLGLFPDFTARAFGLSPKELTYNEALKELNRIQTGFEVRTGARLKGFDERKLLKTFAI